jgi:hypothetical protein
MNQLSEYMECKICERNIHENYITEHHLIPENRKESETIKLCEACHRHLHCQFSNDKLKEKYNTVESLKQADRLQEYIDWISDTNKIHIDVTDNNIKNK